MQPANHEVVETNMDPITLLWLLFVGSGTFLIVLSIPLIQGRIPPNAWYGFRVRRTLENPAVWYPANRYSGWLLLLFAVAFILAASILVSVPGISFETYSWSCLAVVVVGLGKVVFLSFRNLQTLSR